MLRLEARNLTNTLFELQINIFTFAKIMIILKNHLKTITNCSETISPTDFYIDLIEKTLK